MSEPVCTCGRCAPVKIGQELDRLRKALLDKAAEADRWKAKYEYLLATSPTTT